MNAILRNAIAPELTHVGLAIWRGLGSYAPQRGPFFAPSLLVTTRDADGRTTGCSLRVWTAARIGQQPRSYLVTVTPDPYPPDPALPFTEPPDTR